MRLAASGLLDAICMDAGAIRSGDLEPGSWGNPLNTCTLLLGSSGDRLLNRHHTMDTPHFRTKTRQFQTKVWSHFFHLGVLSANLGRPYVLQ